MHIQIIFIGNNIPENNSEAPLLGLAKSIYYFVSNRSDERFCEYFSAYYGGPWVSRHNQIAHGTTK